MELSNFQIFKNKYKKADNQPDYSISMKGADGKYIQCGAGWKKTMSNGEGYISCKVEDKGAKTSPQTPTEADKKAEDDFLAL